MCLASCSISQLIRAAQEGIKLITLLLRTGILPVGTIWMGEGPAQLVLQGLARVQFLEETLRILSPVHTPVLLSSTADALHTGEIQALLLQTLEDAVQGLEPQCHRGIDLMLGFIGDNTFFDRESAGVSVKVEFGDVDDFQVGVDD